MKNKRKETKNMCKEMNKVGAKRQKRACVKEWKKNKYIKEGKGRCVQEGIEEWKKNRKMKEWKGIKEQKKIVKKIY
jgi:hypothetical protein